MKKLTLFLTLLVLALSSCGSKKNESEAQKGVDQSKPENVVQAVFDAAKNQSYENLKGLCDPKGEADGDVKMICELPADKQQEFVSYFSKGKIDGEAKIEGENAEVPILFGPNGTDKETMKLVNRDGKWYLSGF